MARADDETLMKIGISFAVVNAPFSSTRTCLAPPSRLTWGSMGGDSRLSAHERLWPMNNQDKITQFLAGARHAVVGASRDRSKIGNQVLQAYLENERPAYPVNPSAKEIEGVTCYPDLAVLPTPIHGVSIITPPHVSEAIVEQAGAIGVKNIWFQPVPSQNAPFRGRRNWA